VYGRRYCVVKSQQTRYVSAKECATFSHEVSSAVVVSGLINASNKGVYWAPREQVECIERTVKSQSQTMSTVLSESIDTLELGSHRQSSDRSM